MNLNILAKAGSLRKGASTEPRDVEPATVTGDGHIICISYAWDWGWGTWDKSGLVDGPSSICCCSKAPLVAVAGVAITARCASGFPPAIKVEINIKGVSSFLPPPKKTESQTRDNYLSKIGHYWALTAIIDHYWLPGGWAVANILSLRYRVRLLTGSPPKGASQKKKAA